MYRAVARPDDVNTKLANKWTVGNECRRFGCPGSRVLNDDSTAGCDRMYLKSLNSAHWNESRANWKGQM